jgi:hypothetical protein
VQLRMHPTPVFEYAPGRRRTAAAVRQMLLLRLRAWQAGPYQVCHPLGLAQLGVQEQHRRSQRHATHVVACG